MAVLIKSNIQHALMDTPILSSLQATAIIVEVDGFEIIIGTVYQSPRKPLVEDPFKKRWS